MLSKRLIDALYTDAMVLADDVRTYFADESGSVRETLSALDRVMFSCESLKVTTRLMHVIAWLLTQRAVETGELSADGAHAPSRRLGPAVESNVATLAILPFEARRFVEASSELHARAARLEAGIYGQENVASPARHLLARLQQSF